MKIYPTYCPLQQLETLPERSRGGSTDGMDMA